MNTKLLSRAVLAVLAGAALSACVTAPESRPSAAQASPVPAVQPTKVYFYPLQGQSEAQQDRDQYECFNWAVRQTGFTGGPGNIYGYYTFTNLPLQKGNLADTRSRGDNFGRLLALQAVPLHEVLHSPFAGQVVAVGNLLHRAGAAQIIQRHLALERGRILPILATHSFRFNTHFYQN